MKRIGHCKRCGRCCQGKYLFESLTIFAKIVLWIFLREKYKFLGKSGCPYLRYVGKLATCMQYNKRPSFCRQYPAVKGDLIKNCGFEFENEE